MTRLIYIGFGLLYTLESVHGHGYMTGPRSVSWRNIMFLPCQPCSNSTTGWILPKNEVAFGECGIISFLGIKLPKSDDWLIWSSGKIRTFSMCTLKTAAGLYSPCLDISAVPACYNMVSTAEITNRDLILHLSLCHLTFSLFLFLLVWTWTAAQLVSFSRNGMVAPNRKWSTAWNMSSLFKSWGIPCGMWNRPGNEELWYSKVSSSQIVPCFYAFLTNPSITVTSVLPSETHWGVPCQLTFKPRLLKDKMSL